MVKIELNTIERDVLLELIQNELAQLPRTGVYKTTISGMDARSFYWILVDKLTHAQKAAPQKEDDYES